MLSRYLVPRRVEESRYVVVEVGLGLRRIYAEMGKSAELEDTLRRARMDDVFAAGVWTSVAAYIRPYVKQHAWLSRLSYSQLRLWPHLDLEPSWATGVWLPIFECDTQSRSDLSTNINKYGPNWSSAPAAAISELTRELVAERPYRVLVDEEVFSPFSVVYQTPDWSIQCHP